MLKRLHGWQTMAGGMLVAAGVVVLLAGCGSPRERYETLSAFFDGVPNPDAVKKTEAQDGTLVPVMARTVTQHAPFRDNKCDACHRGSNGELQDFAEGYKQCVKCHKTITNEHTLMHGPVVREDCKWCHAPHESAEPALLRDTPVKVCTQCHNKDLLGAKPAEHLDGKTSCLQCHSGHGGTVRYFLKTTDATKHEDAKSTKGYEETHVETTMLAGVVPSEGDGSGGQRGNPSGHGGTETHRDSGFEI